MTTQLTAELVWQAMEKELFAVVGMVTAGQEARTAGIAYMVRERKLYFSSRKEAWKVRHIAANPHVSMTVPIPKRIFFMPWVRIPSATITFSGTARIIDTAEAGPELLRAVFRQFADDPKTLAEACIIEVTPKKEFVTYGVGVTLLQMRDPDLARGRVPVA